MAKGSAPGRWEEGRRAGLPQSSTLESGITAMGVSA